MNILLIYVAIFAANAMQYRQIKNDTQLTRHIYDYAMFNNPTIAHHDLVYIHAKLHFRHTAGALGCHMDPSNHTEVRPTVLRYKMVGDQIRFFYIEVNFIVRDHLGFIFDRLRQKKQLCQFTYDYAVMNF